MTKANGWVPIEGPESGDTELTIIIEVDKSGKIHDAPPKSIVFKQYRNRKVRWYRLDLPPLTE